MGKWHQEEVAGDRYIFDSEANPVICGCPQGAPVFVMPGEHEREAERACAAHNAEVAAIEEDNDVYRELHERLAADNVTLRARVAELENEHSDRLKAVLEYLRENAVAQCECEHNRDGERVYHCDYCQDYENACRIAEGES